MADIILGRKFVNEFGNTIELTVVFTDGPHVQVVMEGPTSTSDNTMTYLEALALRGALAGIADPDAPVPMADTSPPPTARERWFYEQGRLAERDTRTRVAERPVQVCAECDIADCVHIRMARQNQEFLRNLRMKPSDP